MEHGDLRRIPDLLEFGAPTTQAQLDELERAVGELPPSLLEVLRAANGVTSDRVQLYSTADLPERNATFEVPEYAPGCILVGVADSAPLLLTRHAGGALAVADWGDLSSGSRTVLADDLTDWIQQGCPLPEHVHANVLLTGDLHLVARPTGGLRDMFRLKSVLSLDLRAMDMRAALDATPLRVATRIACVRAARCLEADAPDLLVFLAFSEPDDDELVPGPDFLASLRE